MSASRLFAVAVILFVAAFAWLTLGKSVDVRTMSSDEALRSKVGDLWGRPQVQQAPTFYRRGTMQNPVPIQASDLKADFRLDQRRKGLLWYATYAVAFDGAYRLRNDGSAPLDVSMSLPLPAANADYDGFAVRVDGREVDTRFRDGAAVATFTLAPEHTSQVQTGYRTQGLDSWSYSGASRGPNAVRDFTLVMNTDFSNVDFPDGAVSPTAKQQTPAGYRLTWKYDRLVSGRAIALTMPKPVNPGPVASRISYFAPVGLLFYFATLVLLTATRGVKLHPMNYAFLAAGFFAFHLLFAYLADQIDIRAAFIIAALSSVALCVGYLWLVIGPSPALAEAAVAQLLFLVLFSYSFFFEGYTGLTITIGAVVTLAYFMARTGRTDWETVFDHERRLRCPPPAPVSVTPPTT